MTPGRRLLQIWPLLAAAAAATAVHLLLLRYELRTLGEWIRMWRAPGETAAVFPDAVLRLLILHAIINAASGLLYAGLARPLKADVAWMAGGGMAALIPNTICTFAGAVLLIPSLPAWAALFGAGPVASALTPPASGGWLWVSIASFSITTGLIAAPLGMAGSGLGALLKHWRLAVSGS
jgi:hypothetical protein